MKKNIYRIMVAFLLVLIAFSFHLITGKFTTETKEFISASLNILGLMNFMYLIQLREYEANDDTVFITGLISFALSWGVIGTSLMWISVVAVGAAIYVLAREATHWKKAISTVGVVNMFAGTIVSIPALWR